MLFGKRTNNQYSEKYLLSWQKVVLENSPQKLVLSEDDLRKYTAILVNNDVRIITESLKIIETTKYEDTRKSRKQLLTERVNHLELLEPFNNNQNKELLLKARKYCV